MVQFSLWHYSPQKGVRKLPAKTWALLAPALFECLSGRDGFGQCPTAPTSAAAAHPTPELLNQKLGGGPSNPSRDNVVIVLTIFF